MQKFDELLSYFNNYLDNEKFIYEPVELYEPIAYTLALGGKRIRPVMALMACEYLGGDYRKALNPAIGIEIFHNFTLLHDDIMDDAPIRRGKETVYRKWDSNIAILSGDTMFALAYKYITKTEARFLPDILEVFNNTAIEVCEGQQYDMNYESRQEITIADYLNMIRLKTAVFLGAALKIGAIIAESSQSNIDNIYKFGENLGMAFQLQDDLLDVFGEEAKFGKLTGGDIVTNKKTYLYLKAYELANNKQLEILNTNFIQNHPDNNAKILIIKKVYEDLDIRDFVKIEIDNYYVKALSFLDKIETTIEYKQELLEFAKRLIRRDY